MKELQRSLTDTEAALAERQSENITLVGAVGTNEQKIKALGNDLQESRDTGDTLQVRRKHESIAYRVTPHCIYTLNMTFQ